MSHKQIYNTDGKQSRIKKMNNCKYLGLSNQIRIINHKSESIQVCLKNGLNLSNLICNSMCSGFQPTENFIKEKINRHNNLINIPKTFTKYYY